MIITFNLLGNHGISLLCMKYTCSILVLSYIYILFEKGGPQYMIPLEHTPHLNLNWSMYLLLTCSDKPHLDGNVLPQLWHISWASLEVSNGATLVDL